ncbi:MAG: acylneuraminate cytidylyltransferase family protein [Magnetococcales bacterium]|nr:acylneuraminate cytidylyltransferase family protein [Magnetococcales bacterium]MBF0156350.1 acylneuraminate cytidylyltransferase family protein [Magnetococcales bacterium]
MIDGRSVLAVIPARGGSKGLPGKNIRELCGKPLLAWSIEAARGCPELDRVIVSSDDAAILAVARAWGGEVPFVRPAAISGDRVSATEAAIHALENLTPAYDLVVLLQPTSPLRRAEDIRACLALLVATGANSVISVQEVVKSPRWMLTLDAAGEARPLLDSGFDGRQRQELPKVYLPNGAVYVAGAEWLKRRREFFGEGTRLHVMPAERSLDIDTHLDFAQVRLILEESVHADDLSPTSTRGSGSVSGERRGASPGDPLRVAS